MDFPTDTAVASPLAPVQTREIRSPWIQTAWLLSVSMFAYLAVLEVIVVSYFLVKLAEEFFK